MSVFFVTGTDTSVGKTIVSRAIIQAMQNAGIQIVGYKPLACGQDDPVYTDVQESGQTDYDNMDNRDVLVLQDSTNEEVSYQDINSYTFAHTMPMLSQEGKHIDINKINTDLKRLSSRYQSVLVEGSFGWLTPINQDYTFASWAAEHKMPVVLVVGIKEGCMNHALLTVQSIEQMGLPLLGWVANRINPMLGHYAEIIEDLSKRIKAPLLGKIPYMHKPETQELGHYITDIDRLSYMKTEILK
ncbi:MULTISPECIES: dethiobiotin synthase [Basfia]|uniref:ATP-dependent dethiobiotin synthetase BioD n=2 Tax=Basfia TaxID=697331 RepID=BIOD_MANSM|nr:MULTISPECIES: dethiobiotin synthase [Basfia]Q65TU7.1 RecName: Full=ATP-dependent dethiobiotin synthetase BioD; AltName: Full=DTB synthetase; Short=DTBS; AltName: Full=Dethiobiotin synthase [[Mannheimia] succiniciproducens MBEL55E]AAU37613.1 BioD protein [[Mannheimia] succiniciproducens MBEL55E]QIM68387.1 dethiobiotin synthase [Basfia succiniciproducens]SCX90869.1 dethiobiotin synthetase [Basfia succiniciproducens]